MKPYIYLSLALMACSDPTVKLEADDGTIVQFNCNNPSIETQKEIATLLNYLPAITQDMEEKDQFVSLLELSSTMENNDLRAAGARIVQYLCEQ